MFALQSIIATSLLASSALAHFTLDYPATRGFSDELEGQFCGGFNTPASSRQPYPLSSAPIHVTSGHALSTVVAYLSTSLNPTSFNDFNTTSNGTSIPLLTNFFQVTSGSHCFNVDLGALGIGLTNGSEVTLQVQFDGGDGNLYQCTDLVLIEGFEVPSNQTCTNDANTATNATSTSTGASSATSSVASSAASSQAATASASASASASGSSSGAQREVVGWGVAAVLMGVAGLAVL